MVKSAEPIFGPLFPSPYMVYRVDGYLCPSHVVVVFEYLFEEKGVYKDLRVSIQSKGHLLKLCLRNKSS